ncbi:hypothetical protein A1Q2_04941 [Trichosporon asahii var. asahii CBS 8904]|uniref:Deacetylase sirtuin-type domain-containing protein n=1 Tax=Trichosporon asahii var. asahii (strain CBS 8904) TaxID=1220162 RepID=K1WH22_TRIAC|nr:hypothetical protein A1Q2_04941 [Trichosporon asahii var. asahii CBS 8904]
MVRISIPKLPDRPPLPPGPLTRMPVAEAGRWVAGFLRGDKDTEASRAGLREGAQPPERKGAEGTLIVTGAGVSVDSGIRAYRGKEGAYMNPNYHLSNELTPDWARSFLGYPPVKAAQPNPLHIYLASLQALGLSHGLLTQNVDNLHRKALLRLQAVFGEHGARASASRILELHGTLAKVHCLQNGHEGTRDEWQKMLGDLNPIWDQEARDMVAEGRMPRTNPDGDVELPGADYASFVVPPCSQCAAVGQEGVVKPNVIFFGETLPSYVKDESFQLIDAASRLLVLGSTLATYSAFRLIKRAYEAGKPVLLISQGPSRADELDIFRMDRVAGPVMRAALEDLLRGRNDPAARAVRDVWDSGVITAPGAQLPQLPRLEEPAAQRPALA